MKSLINGFFVSFSMYSVIPVKKNIIWDKNTMKFALCFLPLIGLIIGAAEILWLYFCVKFNFDKNLYAAFSVVLPIIISGGIHTDGFIDTADAYFSFADTKKRLEILKDPHVGAFCVIYYGVLLLCEFGLYSQIYNDCGYKYILLSAFVLSRAIGGGMVVEMDCAKNSGLAKTFSDNADKRAVKAVLMFIAAVISLIGIIYYKAFGLVIFAAVIIFYLLYKKMCRLKFGGITGDLAGCFITMIEFIMIAFCCFGGVLI